MSDAPARSGRYPLLKVSMLVGRAPAGRGILLLAALALGCDWVDGLTGPSVPDVAGTYTGPLIFSATTAAEGERMTVTVNGSMTLDVEQDGDRVTIGGSFTIEGDTVAIDAVLGTIAGDGHWTQDAGASGGFTVVDGDCGRTAVSAIWFWIERDMLTVEMGGSSPEPTMECPDITFSARLERG